MDWYLNVLSDYYSASLSWGFSEACGKEPACQGRRDAGSIPGLGRFPGESMATHSSVLAWRSPWTEEPRGLQSIESHRVTWLKQRSTRSQRNMVGDTVISSECRDLFNILFLVPFIYIQTWDCCVVWQFYILFLSVSHIFKIHIYIHIWCAWSQLQYTGSSIFIVAGRIFFFFFIEG